MMANIAQDTGVAMEVMGIIAPKSHPNYRAPTPDPRIPGVRLTMAEQSTPGEASNTELSQLSRPEWNALRGR